MTTPRITVLMPVFNGADYLAEAIESVLGQTCGDYELLLIDDASTDGSPEIIKRYRDTRIRTIRNEKNLGQILSMNLGIKLAASSYIARLDQDDLCLPERLARQAAFLDEHPDTAVVGSLWFDIDEHGQKRGVEGRRVDDYGQFVSLILSAMTPLGHSTAMFRRDEVAHAGGYDAYYAPAEDMALWATLALGRRSANVIRQPLVQIRSHGAQQSVLRSEKQRQSVYRTQDRLLEAFCAPSALANVRLLMRRDAEIWTSCDSPEKLAAACRAWHEMISRIAIELRFSPQEERSFQLQMLRWLGPGVFAGRYVSRWPKTLAYLVVGLFSPACVPPLYAAGKRLTRLARAVVRRLRLIIEVSWRPV